MSLENLKFRIAEVIDANGRLHITEQHLVECDVCHSSDLLERMQRWADENEWRFYWGIEDAGWYRAGNVESKEGERGYVFAKASQGPMDFISEVGFHKC